MQHLHDDEPHSSHTMQSLHEVEHNICLDDKR